MTCLAPDEPIRAAIAALAERSLTRADPHPGEGDDGIAQEIVALARAGILKLPIRRHDAGYAYDLPYRRALPLLVGLGGADLSLGRLVEGHLNALQLVALYGDPDQQRRTADAVEAGVLMGVWGADGTPPFAPEVREDSEIRLHGSKRYCSGLGLLSLALVPYTAEDRTLRLLLVDVADPARSDASAWRMRGMRASRSGAFDFEGLHLPPGAEVGAPDDYRREPFFVGGIWRCAAAQLGAVERIVQLSVETLQASGRAEHPLQLARIGEAILAARDARLQVEAAAAAVESDGDPKLATSLAAFSRLRVEAAGMLVIALAERAIGLALFADGHPLERMTRDLSVYLRQANPDHLLLDHTRQLMARLPEIFR
ncbi:acyl-CoA dehydrogenase family protein [Aureimonas sp. AU12]|uniref:acyl-CoA dehydrogenase family protein n=1 Tax=Aureimonas sp. AU12 TaxID=1638161 RepID=UPI000784BD2C|nr:acyl-CoA dehydrogenase family protein [Aureimonas sp. AU12]